MLNVFVIGLDDVNRSQLERLPGAGVHYCFHSLLDYETVRGVDEFPVEQWLVQCRQELDSFAGSVDAIVSFWDFPITEMAAILTEERRLHGPTLASILRCQHKYWSRRLQSKVVPESTPAFAGVDPFDDAALDRLELPFPFWLKPVRSFRSHLGFRVGSDHDLATAIAEIRSGISRIGEPLQWMMNQVDPPAEVVELGGSSCIAEQLISGRQCTLEGYVFGGNVHVYGVVDSIREANRSTFSRYQYPSRMPGTIQARMIDLTRRSLAAAGFDAGPFNVEFFYDRAGNQIWLLEINCRTSQSHSELFAMVDGVSNLQVMVDLALGNEPQMSVGDGPNTYAAKFFVRSWHDGVVTSVPSPERIAEIEAKVPDTSIHLEVDVGDRLSELADQDSYSYELGIINIGGRSPAELRRKFERCTQELDITFAEEGTPS